MKNLIMADLKVLGNRLWTVPLMAFVLVSGVPLIPYTIRSNTLVLHIP